MLRLALFGHPVAHSRSPAIHAAFGRALGIALDYQAIEVPSPADGARALSRALRAFVAAGGRGANVTQPFKRDAYALCAAPGGSLSPAARRAQAVNTLVIDDAGALHGHNTDGAGLVRDLELNHGVALAGRRVALLGAGGAARAVAAALLEAGVAELRIANRDASRAAALARDLAHPALRVGDYAALAAGRFELVINATAASLADALPPLPPGALGGGGLAYDLAYAEAPTPFRAWARAHGAARDLDGWGMLVEQAAAAFELWTGRRPATADLLATRP